MTVVMQHPLIEKTKTFLPARLDPDTAILLDAFAAHVPREDADMIDPQMLAETVRTHMAMAGARKPGAPAIEISLRTHDSDESWELGSTVIDIVNDDMAFLVDSVAALLTRKYKLIHILLHPIVMLSGHKAGRGGMFLPNGKADVDTPVVRQSHIHIELQGTLPPDQSDALHDDLQAVLSDVRHATRDWREMRARVKSCERHLRKAPEKKYPQDEIAEYLSFLDYLYNDNFTLLGYREYSFTKKDDRIVSRIVKGRSLGLLHDEVSPVYITEDDHALPDKLQKLRYDLPALSVTKINKKSTVHRAVPLDGIAVKHFDDDGNITGESLFIGLFTSVTYSRSIQDVPLLRRKAANITAASGFAAGSHDYKALRHVLEKYPRDEFFQTDDKMLLETCASIMRLQERQRIALYTRLDPFKRYVSCLVYVPRDRYDTNLRVRLQTILEEEFDGTIGDFYTTLDDSPLARVMYVIYLNPKKRRSYDLAAIERRLHDAGRLWSEHLSDALLKEFENENQALHLLGRYGDAFPTGYRETYETKQAVYDLRKIEQVLETEQIALDLYQDKNCAENQLRLKIYHAVTPMTLSDILPILENMGVNVISERPFRVCPQGVDHEVWIHDFMLETGHGAEAVDLARIKDNFEDALVHIWYRDVEDDDLNQLVLGYDMSWRDITVLRAYVRYMRQMGYYFGMRYINQALIRNPFISAEIVRFFKCMHDPASHRKSAAKQCVVSIETSLEKVQSLDEDRILRSVAQLVKATLRTNFFQCDENGRPKPYVSFKMDSAQINDLPRPRPYREIFVYAPGVEGVHLRGDVIARGGIRWSDRLEDFRTEILGLMKAQQVKNAVIVPMGAKGGFVVKNPPAESGRAALVQEAIACYKIFIRGLLDITDNLEGGNVVKPANVICRDGDDPYLVVAADKGTATFSDIANGLSQDYGFWLGDAFASGGSAGYDHKKMGITARGAWESVKRHFRELNHDTQSKPFNVIGVGDMGGDVFGNGMLLSEHIRLIGAFNHMHIFCDPDPDPARSFKERKRLFEAVQGWDAYDEKALSKGGRIFLRTDKSLKLTPEIKATFGISEDSLSPTELIGVMLRAKVDLLWFGGIGTYIKAASEHHLDVGDKANDLLRVNAGGVQARVIGEGANLAVTQKARIEMARKGVRLNADFIDNSGGVDSSDHEVNIKILTAAIIDEGKKGLTVKKRNSLLEKMTDEVAALVLRSNYQQTQAISLMEIQAAENLDIHARFIDDLEKKHGIDREIECLPDADEIEKRMQEGKGLTRPELSIIQAHAKILFAKDLLASDVPDLPAMQDYWLLDYFPAPLRRKYRDEILGHRLRREIIAMTISSSLVNRMGPTFIKKLIDKTGCSPSDIARAYMIVRDSFGLREMWDEIEALDSRIPAAVQLRSMRYIAAMVERETVWALTYLGRMPDIAAHVGVFGKHIARLRQTLTETLTPDLRDLIEQRVRVSVSDGVPEDLAFKIASISIMGASFDIIRISLDQKASLEVTARLYFEIGSFFHLKWLREQARFMSSDGTWSDEATNTLMESLYASQASLTAYLLSYMDKKTKAGKQETAGESFVEKWTDEHSDRTDKLMDLLDRIHRSGSLDLSMLVIADQRIRALCAS